MCGVVVGQYVEFNLSGFLDPVDFWKDLGQSPLMLLGWELYLILRSQAWKSKIYIGTTCVFFSQK